MKRLATFVFAFLLVSSLSFAQAGSTDKPKTDKGTTTDTGKKSKKAKKSKKSKKGSSDSTTTAPPK